MVEDKIRNAAAAGKIPDEFTIEYLMETRDPPAIAALISLVTLTGIIVGARCLSRLLIVKSFGLDDGLALFSLALFITFVVLCIILIQLGSGRHIQYIHYILTADETNWTESLDFAAHLLYTSALYFCRMSGLAFYHRLCKHHTFLSLAIKVGAVFLTAAYLPQMFLIIFHCAPVTSSWPYEWQPQAARHTCLIWGTVYVVNSGLSLVCDFVVFTIPIFMIHSLNISRTRRIHLSGLLLPGVLVIAISIVRLDLVVRGQWVIDGSWFYNPMLVIESAEIGCTLIALSVPGLKPLLGSWAERFGLSSRSTTCPTLGNHVVTVGSAGKKKMKGARSMDSTEELYEDEMGGTGDSGEVSLVEADVKSQRSKGSIQVRTSLHLESNSTNGRDIRLELYPRIWECSKNEI